MSGECFRVREYSKPMEVQDVGDQRSWQDVQIGDEVVLYLREETRKELPRPDATHGDQIVVRVRSVDGEKLEGVISGSNIFSARDVVGLSKGSALTFFERQVFSIRSRAIQRHC